jgi:thymidylate synthase ThyX
MISAEINKDSIGPSGIRLTTFVLKYPRFIHSEVMTHRTFSRNASSSRAIPLEKQIKMLEQDIAYPEKFLRNKKGMQGGEPFSKDNEQKARIFWKLAAQNAINSARLINGLEEDGAHKQYVNRLLEPFAHISVIVTATDYDNFFNLRYHEDAQPEIYELAKQMYQQYKGGKPEVLMDGEWHLPFITEEDCTNLTKTQQLQKSVACCARVSYNNHDGTTPSLEANEKLYNRLLGTQPLHSSPAEHQAMAIGDARVRSGNFRGWVQYRQTLKNESCSKFQK